MKNSIMYRVFEVVVKFLTLTTLTLASILILWFSVIDARVDSQRGDTNALIKHMETEMTFSKQHGMQMKSLDRTGGVIGNRNYVIQADDKKDFVVDEIREGKYGWYLGKTGFVKYTKTDKRFVSYDDVITDYDNVTLKGLGVMPYYYEDLVKMTMETLVIFGIMTGVWFLIYGFYLMVASIDRRLKHPSEKVPMTFGTLLMNTYFVYTVSMFLLCIAFIGFSNPWVIVLPAIALLIILNYVFVSEYGNFSKDSDARKNKRENREKKRQELLDKKST